MSLPNFGNVFPDDILGRIRDLEDRINQLTGGTYGKVTVAGDVTGLSDDTTVERLQGSAVSSAAPSSGQVLEWNGSAWTPTTITTFVPQIFGSGFDGAHTIDYNSTKTWTDETTIGSYKQFTLLRDVYFTSFTLDNSAGNVEFATNGFRIYCTGTTTIGAGVIVRHNGSSASSSTGAAKANTGTTGRTGSYGDGSNGSTGTAQTPLDSNDSLAYNFTNSSPAYGGDGGAATGGPGTGGGRGGGSANLITTSGSPFNLMQAVTTTTAFLQKFEGGAGGAGGNGSSGTGGGGGGGAGILAIFSKCLVNNGTLRVKGGDGGPATGTNGGGGGGGTGGGILLVYGSSGSSIGTTDVTGGTGGAGIGTGKNGGNGASGYVWDIGL